MEVLNLLLLLNERISPKFLKKFPEYSIMSQKSSKMKQKSNSPFPSVSAAGLLGLNLVDLNDPNVILKSTEYLCIILNTQVEN